MAKNTLKNEIRKEEETTHKCARCFQVKPLSEMVAVKGRNMGYCKRCRNAKRRHSHWKNKKFKAQGRGLVHVVEVNYDILMALPVGKTYIVESNSPGVQEPGWLSVQGDSILISLWGRIKDFFPQYQGIARYLAEHNCVVTPQEVKLKNPDDTPLDLALLAQPVKLDPKDFIID